MNTYNGWTNYETWRVALEVADGLDGYHDPETLKDIAEDVYLFDVDNQLAEGLVMAFLGEVNWTEIAEHLKEEDVA